MRGDIVRGIVELVTNSDAAYTAIGVMEADKRPITIILNPTERWLEVRDRAGGMSPQVADEKFTKGGATSAQDQRGYFGLGAKDCAIFGSLVLKTVDDEGNFTEIYIPGNFEDCTWDSYSALPEHYRQIHSQVRRRPGTMVHINIDKIKQGGARIPRFHKLIADLQSHYALRRLHQRNAIIVRSAGKTPISENIVYPGFPWEIQHAECLYDEILEIKKYPESHPRVRLFRISNPVQGDASSEAFQGFLLVGTKDIADYGFTLAGMEKRNHSRYLVGEVDDSYIQTLLKDYRINGTSEQNPRPVVGQDRYPRNGGLDDSHPYTNSLFSALQPIISSALDRLDSESKARARSGISEALQSANELAGRRLSQFLDAEGAAPTPKPLPTGFYFLPHSKVLKLDPTNWESVSLYSIPIDSEVAPPITSASLLLEDHNLCEIGHDIAKLTKMPGDLLGYRATIRLRSRGQLGHTTLSAFMNNTSAQAAISVKDVQLPPTLFQFERSRYTIPQNRRRIAKVIIPESMIIDQSNPSIVLSLSDSNGGIVICDQPSKSFYNCDFDNQRLAYIVPFELEGTQIGARAKLIASFQSHITEAHITVTGGALKIFFDDTEKSPPDQRAKVYDLGDICSDARHRNEICLHVFARHPRIEPYLGSPTNSSTRTFWGLNDSPGFRAMYADAIAEAIAEFKVANSASATSSPQDIFPLFWDEKKKALALTQQVYIDGDSWNSQRD